MTTAKTVTLSHLSTYKSGSPSSTTKGLEKNRIQPRSYMIQHTYITCYINFTNSRDTSEFKYNYYNTRFKFSSGSNIVLKQHTHTLNSNICQFHDQVNKSNIDKIPRKVLPAASLLVHSWRETVLAVTRVYYTICNKGGINPEYGNVPH
jgi:hypothetical protein